MKRVLILQAGSTEPALRARFGDFPEWFARRLGTRVELRVARATAGELPSSSRFDGIIVTGSPQSVREREGWMKDLAVYALEAARTRPVLGVCFGHQLLAEALGGWVEKNPRGREAGTTEVFLTEAGRRDPLFAGFPPRFAVQQTHEDHVPAVPPGAALLAGNDHSPVQAFSHGDMLRCVQFHPEMDAARSRVLAELRREHLDRSTPGGSRAVLASIRETPHGTRVLGAWLTRFVGAA